MPHTTKAIINLAAIRHNLSIVKQLAPHSKVMAVIKADAYGHGLIEIAQTLADAEGLAVARLEEALLLRGENIEQRILLLGGFIDMASLQQCAEHSIDIVIHSWNSVETLLTATLEKPVNVWLKHNSGMHRLGLSIEEFRQADPLLGSCANVAEKIFMTHFSASDETDSTSTDQQLAAFQQATEGLEAPLSLANSAAIIKHQHTHADWVRPGIMLFGANPIGANSQPQFPVDLLPAMTLSAHVMAIRTIEKGASVGYNGCWIADRESKIATVGIGYGDGYPRHASNGTPVLVNGQRATLAGTVSMDLITIDITDCQSVNISDEVILWGEGLKAETIATYADTISYELFTSISKRVPRLYLNPGPNRTIPKAIEI
ncbi:MAG: alanine racemase [Pseudomonadales bacterium]